MAGIQNLAIVDDTTGHAFGSGTVAFTASNNYLCSVIATNTSAVDGVIYVTVVPTGSTEEDGALIAYNLPLPAYNSYETFRFGINNTDSIYVAGSAGVRYFVQGIVQA